jgi:hypothetical protein
MSRPPRPTGPRDSSYPTCPTHELLAVELAKEAQELTWILAQWRAAAGPRASTPDPITRIKIVVEDPPPAYLDRKARTHV